MNIPAWAVPQCGEMNPKSCNAECAEIAGKRCAKDPNWSAPADEGEFFAIGITAIGCCKSVARPLRGQRDWSRCGEFFGYTADRFIKDCKAALKSYP